MNLVKTFSFIVLMITIISCEFPDCSNVPDTYYNMYDDEVIHYIQLNKDYTFLQYYEKEGKKYSHTGKWRIKKGKCIVELDNWTVYGEQEIKNMGGFGGVKFGSSMGNQLFWPYEHCLESNPDTYLEYGFVRESYIKTYKELVEKARIKDSLYWADTDTLYYRTGEIKEIGKRHFRNVSDDTLSRKGPWKEYYKDGTLKGEGSYNPGKNYIWKYYYNTGELEAVGYYEANMKVGPWEYYHKNGVIKEKGIYIYTNNDSLKFEKKRGKWQYYNTSGKLIRVKNYKSVEKSLDSIFRADGRKYISDAIQNTKERWYIPMQEYKEALRKQDSIAKSNN